MISKSIGFRLNGEVYEIRPIDVSTFFKVSNSLAKMDMLKSKEKIGQDELLNSYAEIFSLVCPEIKREMLDNMTHGQIGALFNLILECIMGKAQVDAEKKSQEMKE
jgi:hypothetical protein